MFILTWIPGVDRLNSSTSFLMYAPSPPVKPFQNVRVTVEPLASLGVRDSWHPPRAAAAPVPSAHVMKCLRLSDEAKRDGGIVLGGMAHRGDMTNPGRLAVSSNVRLARAPGPLLDIHGSRILV